MINFETHCPFCGKTTVISVPARGFRAWQEGLLIQHAMPELSPEEREMLKTGICPKCWDEMFSEEEEDEEEELMDENEFASVMGILETW